jgi:RES domain-containing protein
MFVYRIAKKEFSTLNGLGGFFGQGRWHRKGTPIIYTSEHASLAAWEKIVHIVSLKNLPEDLLLTKIKTPDIKIHLVPESILVQRWDSYPFIEKTIKFGTDFLREGKHLALKVPSVVIPEEFNIILNPLHPDMQDCKIIKSIPFSFDKRILK